MQLQKMVISVFANTNIRNTQNGEIQLTSVNGISHNSCKKKSILLDGYFSLYGQNICNRYRGKKTIIFSPSTIIDKKEFLLKQNK